MSTTMEIDAVIARSDREFPALYQLFGGYFHEDWKAEHSSPDTAVRAFIADAPPEAISAASEELDRVLSSGFDDAALTRLLEDGFRCDYVPASDSITASDWLARVRAELQR